MFEMRTHEIKRISEYTEVLRVPTGWIYKFYEVNRSNGMVELRSTAFVPERI